jgi:hypothetical protein
MLTFSYMVLAAEDGEQDRARHGFTSVENWVWKHHDLPLRSTPHASPQMD